MSGKALNPKFEFKVDIKNPCNKGNRVVFVDTEKNLDGTVLSWEMDPIMIKWTKVVIDLNQVFID
jgi:pimeloyl-CoA synthetase